MAENFFINPRLQATRTGTADAAREVAVWVDQLSAIVELDIATDHETYDLLAHRERLRRVRPELLEAAGASAALQRADQLVSGRGEELAQRALTVPNPQAWLEEAAQLEASYEDLIEPSERAVWAARLLDDLDDAELVLVAAGRLGLEDAELAGELNECTAWLAEHADVFLAASVYVQGIGLALRPDLDETDYDLAATALMFADIVRAAGKAERELGLENVMPLPQHVANGLYMRFREEQAAIVMVPLLALLNAYQRALRRRAGFSGTSEEAPTETIVKWVSPTRDLVAYMPISAEGDLTATFYTASGEPAVQQLADQPVFLDGVPAQITRDACATFERQKLTMASDLALCLEVGVDRSRWDLQES